MIVLMRRRWNTWRRRQRSRIVYALVPGPARLVASGPRTTVQLVELHLPGMGL